MIRDYSSRYPSVVHGKQKVKGRKSGSPPGSTRITKIVGLVITVAMIVGIAISFWFGWVVRNGLDELAGSQARRQELKAENGNLVAQRDHLLSREKIEATAKELGLYPPSARQIRRP